MMSCYFYFFIIIIIIMKFLIHIPSIHIHENPNELWHILSSPETSFSFSVLLFFSDVNVVDIVDDGGDGGVGVFNNDNNSEEGDHERG